MKTIKIFFASSKELEDDREAFGNLIRILSNTCKNQGIALDLEYEDYDAVYNNPRKQDEYNDQVRSSDMFLAVFHLVGEKFTIEEFKIATEEFKKKGAPKAYVYCKKLSDGEVESPELTAFKNKLADELGHFWCEFANRDTLQLHFVMQLLKQLSISGLNLATEGDYIVLDGQQLMSMNSIPFAINNKEYVQMRDSLLSCQKSVDAARERALNDPKNDELQNQLQDRINESNEKRVAFKSYQTLLLSTAQRISQLQTETINNRMRRAIEAFNGGRVTEANIILEEVEEDADNAFEKYKEALNIVEQQRNLVVNSIVEILLKATMVVADITKSADERYELANSLYIKAGEMAKGVDCDVNLRAKILFEYATLLSNFGHYDEAIDSYLSIFELQTNSLNSTLEYDDAMINTLIGENYSKLSKYDDSLKYYNNALDICKSKSGDDSLNIATLYKKIGSIHYDLCSYDTALDYYLKALEIQNKILCDHIDTALTYSELAKIYKHIGELEEVKNHMLKALEIAKECNSDFSDNDLPIINALGSLFIDYDNDYALEQFQECLDICISENGPKHPAAAKYYSEIGKCYDSMNQFDKALYYLNKALQINEYSLGSTHPIVAQSYVDLGVHYEYLADDGSGASIEKDGVVWSNYCQAIDFYEKAIAIHNKVLETNNPDVALILVKIATIYGKFGSDNNENAHSAKEKSELYNTKYECSEPLYFTKALKYLEDALKIQMANYGENHLDTAATNKLIAYIYYCLCQYENAQAYCSKAYQTQQQLLGSDHPETEKTRELWGKINSTINESEMGWVSKLHWSLKIVLALVSLVIIILFLPITLLWIFLFWKKNVKKYRLKHQSKRE